MSNMKIFRTGLSVTPQNLYKQIEKIFTNNFEWHKTEAGTGDSRKYYIDEATYIEVAFTGGVKISLNSNVISLSYDWSGTSSTNASVYKINNAAAISVLSSSVISNYNYNSIFIIDSTGENKSVIYNMNNSNYCNVINNKIATENDQIPNIYKPYGSMSSSPSNVAQFAPFINSLTGEQFDTVKGVLMTPINNSIVNLNGEKWLITSGFALPCGEPEYIYISDE